MTTTPSNSFNPAIVPDGNPKVGKNQFIRHELKTPVGSIKGYLSMLEEGDYGKLELTPDQKEIILKIKTDLEELTGKIDTLLPD